MAADRNGFDPFPGSLLLPNANYPGPADLYQSPESPSRPWPANPFQPTTNYCFFYEGEK